MRLLTSNKYTDEELNQLAKKHRGRYSTWTGALLHVAEKSRPDLAYAAMRLTGYNANPKAPCFQALHQTMCYLWHHPHVPIMYPRKDREEEPLSIYTKNGKAEIIQKSSDVSNDSTLENKTSSYSDGDFGRDLLDQRSTTSTVHLWLNVIFDWYCGKQAMTADCTNGSEIRALHYCIRRLVVHRRFLISGGYDINGPIIAYEDNSATISQVLKD